MSARTVRRLLPMIAVAVFACTRGGWSRDVSTLSRGLEARFDIGGERYTGELLMADAAGILVLVDDAPASASWADIDRFRLSNLGTWSLDSGGLPSVEALERIRLGARYPWPLTDEQFREVAQRSGWGELREIGR